MRVNHATPSFDPLTPAWDQQRNFPDGSFAEYGGVAVSRYRYHVTYCLRSAISRAIVFVAGRCLKPKSRKADFLSIRIGADPARYYLLSREETLFLTVDANMTLTSSKKAISQEKFMKSWGDILHDLEQKRFEIKAGILSVIEK